MRLFLATAAALLTLAAPAAAAPTWLQPVTLSPQSDGEVLGAEIVGDESGRILSVWPKFSGGKWLLQYSRRAPGGGFTPAQTLVGPLDVQSDFDVGIDGGGTATVVWTEPDGPATVVKTIRIAANGARAGAQTLTADGSQPQVAVNGAGQAIALWRTENVLRAAARSQPGDAFTAMPDPVSPSPSALVLTEPDVAIDASGDAVAAWVRNDQVEANARPAGQSWLGTTTIVNGATANNLALAMAPGGQATLMWTNFTAPTRIYATERTAAPTFAAGGWDDAAPASPTGVTATDASVALDANNTAVAVWVGTQGGTTTVQGAQRPSGGSFQNVQPLSNATMGTFGARVDTAPDGSAVAIWRGTSGGKPAIQASRRPANGNFGGVSTIALGDDTSDPSVQLFVPALTVDGQGNAAAVWSRFRQSLGLGINDWRLDAAGFDAAPPSFAAVSVPPAASVGAGVGMAVAATDRWTPVTLSWSFGDGTGAAGGAVTHAFGTQGTFGVTVTARDAVGNAASATRPIAIAGPAIVPRIDSTVQTKWAYDAATGKRFVLLRLKVVKPPKGSAVQIRCAGKKCPYRSKRATRMRKGDITVFKLRTPGKAAKSKARRFRAGQRVQVRVTAAGYIGKVVKFKLKRRKDPVGKVRCLPIGATKPRKTC